MGKNSLIILGLCLGKNSVIIILGVYVVKNSVIILGLCMVRTV